MPVLSTEAAETAIKQMQKIISGGLMEQIKSLDREGQLLCDPKVWDGKLAADFRQQWPDTNRALDKVITELEELRGKVQSINNDIMRAGGNP